MSIRVLLADDDELVREVSTALLDSLDCQVACASDGQEAFELFKAKGPFDVVFVDCQMPVLNGYETALCLREYERENYGSKWTPIIALTGEAGDDIRKRFFSVGIDDHLVKPINLAVLENTLDHWFYAESNHLDFSAIQMLQSLRSAKNPNFTQSVLAGFVKDAEHLLKEMHAAIFQNDDATMKAHAHRLKASAAVAGAKKLSRLCANIEEKSVLDQKQAVESLLQLIETEFQLVCPMLKNHLDGTPS